MEKSTYLLNEKAYEIYTKQSAKEIFKTKALKAVELTEKELKEINPIQTDDAQKAKVFTYNAVGITRITFNGKTKQTNTNKHLSDEAYEAGKKAGGY